MSRHRALWQAGARYRKEAAAWVARLNASAGRPRPNQSGFLDPGCVLPAALMASDLRDVRELDKAREMQ